MRYLYLLPQGTERILRGILCVYLCVLHGCTVDVLLCSMSCIRALTIVIRRLRLGLGLPTVGTLNDDVVLYGCNTSSINELHEWYIGGV